MCVQTLAYEGVCKCSLHVCVCANIDTLLCEWSVIQHPVHARDTRGSQTDGMWLITVHLQVHNIKIIALTPVSNKKDIHCIRYYIQTFSKLNSDIWRNKWDGFLFRKKKKRFNTLSKAPRGINTLFIILK